MTHCSWSQVWPVLGTALGWACLALPLAAAPVLGVDPPAAESLAVALPAAAASAQALPPPSMRALDQSMTPQARTGVGELDLLLQSAGQPVRPDAPSHRPAMVSAAAASAAAAELAALRLRARSLATAADPEPAEQGLEARKALPLQPLGNLGTLQGDVRKVETAPRREWVGAAEGGPVSGQGWQPSPRGSADRPPALDPDHPLLRWPREAIEFMRDNRYLLLAMGGLVLVMVALLRLYSRRL